MRAFQQEMVKNRMINVPFDILLKDIKSVTLLNIWFDC